MNSRQMNTLSMLLAVKVFCSNLSAIFALLPNFSVLLTQLGDIIKNIQDQSVIQVKDYKGKTDQKNFYTMDLISITIEIIHGAVAYARVNNLFELLEALNYTESEMKRMPDSKLQSVCQLVHEEVSLVIGSLGNYGVTQAMLDQQEHVLVDYANGLTGPREGIIVRKNATAAIKVSFKESRGVLGTMDKLALTLKKKNPDAFNSFKNARQIVDYGKGKRAGVWYVEGKVVDFDSGMPLGGVSVSIVGTLLVMMTGIDGIFRLKVPGPGQYMLRAENPYYGVKMEEVILFGEPMELVIEMEKKEE